MSDKEVGINQNSVKTPLVIEPFYWTLYLTVGIEELKFLLEEKKLALADVGMSEKEVDCTLGLCQEMEDVAGSPLSLMYFSQDGLDHDTIGHEALHLVHQIMESRGVPINAENTEIQAYLQELIVYEVKKVLVKRGYLPKGSAKRPNRPTV